MDIKTRVTPVLIDGEKVMSTFGVMATLPCKSALEERRRITDSKDHCGAVHIRPGGPDESMKVAQHQMVLTPRRSRFMLLLFTACLSWFIAVVPAIAREFNSGGLSPADPRFWAALTVYNNTVPFIDRGLLHSGTLTINGYLATGYHQNRFLSYGITGLVSADGWTVYRATRVAVVASTGDTITYRVEMNQYLTEEDFDIGIFWDSSDTTLLFRRSITRTFDVTPIRSGVYNVAGTPELPLPVLVAVSSALSGGFLRLRRRKVSTQTKTRRW